MATLSLSVSSKLGGSKPPEPAAIKVPLTLLVRRNPVWVLRDGFGKARAYRRSRGTLSKEDRRSGHTLREVEIIYRLHLGKRVKLESLWESKR